MEYTIHTAPVERMRKFLEDEKNKDFGEEEVCVLKRRRMDFSECIEPTLIKEVSRKTVRSIGNGLGIKPIKLDREFQGTVRLEYGDLTIAGIVRERLFNNWVECYIWLNEEYVGQVRWVNTQRLTYFPIWCIPWDLSKKGQRRFKAKGGKIRDNKKLLDMSIRDVISLVNEVAPTDKEWGIPEEVHLEKA